jgi:AraC family transcriptional regulator
VKKATAWADAHLAEAVTVERLAAVAGLSVTGFKHTFREITGITPHAYLLRKRVERARTLLDGNKGSVTDIALACGFPSSQYFATVFKRIVGVTPSDLLKKHGVPLPSDTDGQ